MDADRIDIIKGILSGIADRSGAFPFVENVLEIEPDDESMPEVFPCAVIKRVSNPLGSEDGQTSRKWNNGDGTITVRKRLASEKQQYDIEIWTNNIYDLVYNPDDAPWKDFVHQLSISCSLRKNRLSHDGDYIGVEYLGSGFPERKNRSKKGKIYIGYVRVRLTDGVYVNTIAPEFPRQENVLIDTGTD